MTSCPVGVRSTTVLQLLLIPDLFQASQMVCDSLDWSKKIIFGAISEWQLPSLIKICSKHSSIRYCVDCPLYQRPDGNLPDSDDKPEESGAVVKPLEKRLVGVAGPGTTERKV